MAVFQNSKGAFGLVSGFAMPQLTEVTAQLATREDPEARSNPIENSLAHFRESFNATIFGSTTVVAAAVDLGRRE